MGEQVDEALVRELAQPTGPWLIADAVAGRGLMGDGRVGDGTVGDGVA